MHSNNQLTEIRPRRSVLYMPGSNAKALEKARSLAADALIFDLEDAVAPEQKSAARNAVLATIKLGGFGRRETVIRVNPLGSQFFADDMQMAAIAAPDAVLVPKVQSQDDIVAVAAALANASAPGSIAIWGMMESPLAILGAESIARAARNLTNRSFTTMVMGTNDLAKDTRARLAPGRAAMSAWLSTCVAAARAHGLDIIDGVYNDISDISGFRAECEQGRDFGMDGKTLIHPGQIDVCNDVFSPQAEEVDWARRVVAAFADPANAGKGAIRVEGRMVELLHAEMAARVIAVAGAIAATAI